jgi:hypothetical protein
MKPFSKIALIGACTVVTAIVAVAPLRSQNAVPAVVVEQYRILPGMNQIGQPKADAQIERELNTLAADGWKVRAANQTSIILAR